MASIELVVPPRRDYLALVRAVAAAAASVEDPLPGARLDDLRLAVSEAFANAVEAVDALDADRDRVTRAGQPIQVHCEVEGDEVTVTVEDQGGGFDPEGLAALPPAGDPRRLGHERGLGLPIMRSVASELSFEPAADGTRVRIRIDRGLHRT
ncbi:MAG: ATP-binding protein [Acidimicrobiia bacterium]